MRLRDLSQWPRGWLQREKREDEEIKIEMVVHLYVSEIAEFDLRVIFIPDRGKPLKRVETKYSLFFRDSIQFRATQCP